MSIPKSNDNAVAGIFWMLMTMFFFITLDAQAKHLTQTYPAIQVTWARFFFHTLLLVVYLRHRFPAAIKSKDTKRQLWRSLLMFITNACFFIGVVSIPLATASTILFLSPIFITMLAIPMLGEKVGFRRWIGVGVGFVGSIIVVRPDTSGISLGVGFLLLAALANAVYQIVTRQIRNADSEITSVIYTGLIGSILASLIVPFFWVQPAPVDWLFFAGMGVVGILGHLCLVKAFSLAEASMLAPFSYSSLIWASLYGFILFNELPSLNTLLGAALIIASGLYIFYRERRLVP